MHTNTGTHEGEVVVERGTSDDGVPFIITTKGGYPNIVNIRYDGEDIPSVFQVKEKKTAKELKLK